MKDSQKKAKIKTLEEGLLEKDRKIAVLKLALREIQKVQEKKNQGQEGQVLDNLEDEINQL